MEGVSQYQDGGHIRFHAGKPLYDIFWVGMKNEEEQAGTPNNAWCG